MNCTLPKPTVAVYVTIQTTTNSSKAIIHFYYAKGGKFTLIAYVYQVKVLPKLLSSILLWILDFSPLIQ